MADDFKLRTAGATLPLLRGIGRSRRRSEKREAKIMAKLQLWKMTHAHDGDGCRGKDENEAERKKESSLRLPRVNKWPTVGVGL